MVLADFDTGHVSSADDVGDQYVKQGKSVGGEEVRPFREIV